MWEAEKHPKDVEFFVLKDVNPRKPNRWAGAAEGARRRAAPHSPTAGGRPAAAVEVRRPGGEREISARNGRSPTNGSEVRTQCHLHIHVGRFIRAAENSKFRIVKRPEDFPGPELTGVWIHPVPGGYHVHEDEQIMETALVR